MIPISKIIGNNRYLLSLVHRLRYQCYGQKGLFIGAIGLSSFPMLVPFQSMKQGTMISLDSLGSKGIFVSIITAIITTEIYCKICTANITIKMPKSVPPMIADSFIAIIPGAVPLLLANTVRYIFTYTNYKDAIGFVYKVLQQPLLGLGGTLPTVILAVFLMQLFWRFGIHGTLLVNSVIDPIMTALAIQNYEAYKNGAKHLPHIINTTFMGIFVNQGMQLGVYLVFGFFLAKSIRMKTTMRTILAPLASIIVSYFAISVGLVPSPIFLAA